MPRRTAKAQSRHRKIKGFGIVGKLPSGFSLLALKLNPNAPDPTFRECVQNGDCPEKKGLTVYYSHRCPFTEHYVRNELTAAARERNIPLHIVELKTAEEAQSTSSPATVFSLFLNGKFWTTDLSVCIGSRLDKAFRQR